MRFEIWDLGGVKSLQGMQNLIRCDAHAIAGFREGGRWSGKSLSGQSTTKRKGKTNLDEAEMDHDLDKQTGFCFPAKFFYFSLNVLVMLKWSFRHFEHRRKIWFQKSTELGEAGGSQPLSLNASTGLSRGWREKVRQRCISV